MKNGVYERRFQKKTDICYWPSVMVALVRRMMGRVVPVMKEPHLVKEMLVRDVKVSEMSVASSGEGSWGPCLESLSLLAYYDWE